MEEYTEVLKRPKFKLDPVAVDAFLHDLTQAATAVHPTRRISACPDEDDNRFLECAHKASAQYVVTGNKRHFPFAEFEGITIISPAEFVRVLTEEGNQPSR